MHMIMLQEYIQYVTKNGQRILAIGCIAGVDIPIGKQVKDAGMDV